MRCIVGLLVLWSAGCHIQGDDPETWLPSDTDDVPPQTRCALTPAALDLGPQPSYLKTTTLEVLQPGSVCASSAKLVGGFDVDFDSAQSPQIHIPHSPWVPDIRVNYDTICKVGDGTSPTAETNGRARSTWQAGQRGEDPTRTHWVEPITDELAPIAVVSVSVPVFLPNMTVWIKAAERDENGFITQWDGYAWCEPVGTLGTNPFLYPDNLLIDEKPFARTSFVPR